MKTILSTLLAVFLLSGCASLQPEKVQEKTRLLLQLAAERLGQRQYNSAIEAVQEAIQLDPKSASAYNHLALIYMETKRYDKSEEAFKKALEFQPKYPEALNNYGVLKNRQDKHKEAIALFQTALEDDNYLTPENAYTNLGLSYFRLGDMKKSKLYHEKALDVSPMFCLASKNLADVYAKEKNYNKAAENYEKAVTHCPFFQESHYKLGLVLMKLGQKNVAKTELEKLIDRHKNGPFVERSQEVLKYLR